MGIGAQTSAFVNFDRGYEYPVVSTCKCCVVPINEGNVNSANNFGIGVDDFQRRETIQLHRLIDLS
jgi:hypothetical protein